MCVGRRYNSNGTLMFLATDNGTLELFRRAPDGTHSHLHTIVRHQYDLQDCDIAPDDSCTRFSPFVCHAAFSSSHSNWWCTDSINAIVCVCAPPTDVVAGSHDGTVAYITLNT